MERTKQKTIGTKDNLLKRNAESERRKRNNEFYILWDSNRNNEIGRN